MLSYQHVYHAGNKADCHKHALLAVLLNGLKKESMPFAYIDTHSGRGLYDLQAPEMRKLGEYKNGIQRLWSAPNWPRDAYPYRRVLEALNRGAVALRFYPGSPWIAEASRRPQDSLYVFELHPQEHRALHNVMKKLPGVAVVHEDGWSVAEHPVTAITRGLIMIDPSFEVKKEYDMIAQRLSRITETYPGYIVALWYPILAETRHLEMTTALEKLPLAFHKSETLFDDETGMIGSGLFVINPPQNFAATDRILCDWLKQTLK
jgi:23S rRNA (adenine2030-N6)-methyltransferase